MLNQLIYFSSRQILHHLVDIEKNVYRKDKRFRIYKPLMPPDTMPTNEALMGESEIAYNVRLIEFLLNK